MLSCALLQSLLQISSLLLSVRSVTYRCDSRYKARHGVWARRASVCGTCWMELGVRSPPSRVSPCEIVFVAIKPKAPHSRRMLNTRRKK